LSAGGHGHEAHGSAAALWAVRLAVVAVGGFGGYRLNERVNRALLAFFKGFNRVFERLTTGYGRIVSGLVRATGVILLLYGGLMVHTCGWLRIVPVLIIPEQDKGYLVVDEKLPEGARLGRTE